MSGILTFFTLNGIGHFRVPPGFCIKTRLSDQPFDMDKFSILKQIKLIFTRKAAHLTSF